MCEGSQLSLYENSHVGSRIATMKRGRKGGREGEGEGEKIFKLAKGTCMLSRSKGFISGLEKRLDRKLSIAHFRTWVLQGRVNAGYQNHVSC